MSTAVRDLIYEGQGRPRKRKLAGTRLRSHYQFANWAYDDGKRFAVPVGGVKKDTRGEYPLISTTLKNEGSDTETLIWMHFDLDFKRADKKWRKDEMLDWPKMAETLREEVPELFKYLTAITRSSGGKGLGLALAVSPLELIPETANVQKLGYRLQDWIIRILNFYGMGADEGARGLKRLMPNLFQPDRLLDRDEITEAMVQTRRPRVIQQLLYALRFHCALKAPKKAQQADLLWRDIRVEKPCARLYTDLLDSAGAWGSEQLTAQEIIHRYGMSKNTVYKFLSTPPTWLSVDHIEGEGYRLSVRPSQAFTNRAYKLIETGGEGRPKGSFPSFVTATICEPKEVLDGDRNQWLVSVILACKWRGVARAELLPVLKEIVKVVPSYKESRSLTRELSSIVRSLYHHRSSRIGSSPDLALPEWLDEALAVNQPKRLSQIITMKGTVGSRTLPLTSNLAIDWVRSSLASEGISNLGRVPSDAEVPGELGASGYAQEMESASPSLAVTHSCFRVFCHAPAVLDTGLKLSDREKPSLTLESDGGDTKPLLSGSALRRAFSKALIKSIRSAGEKAKILAEVSALSAELRDSAMLEYLLALTSP